MDTRSNRRSSVFDRPPRPGLFSLVVDIFRGTLLGSMTLPVLLIAAITLALHINQLPYREFATAVLLTAIVLSGLWRGCTDWQQQRADYQRELLRMRRRALRQKVAVDQETPGFIPFYHN